jgi:hypothetical protein
MGVARLGTRGARQTEAADSIAADLTINDATVAADLAGAAGLTGRLVCVGLLPHRASRTEFARARGVPASQAANAACRTCAKRHDSPIVTWCTHTFIRAWIHSHIERRHANLPMRFGHAGHLIRFMRRSTQLALSPVVTESTERAQSALCVDIVSDNQQYVVKRSLRSRSRSWFTPLTYAINADEAVGITHQTKRVIDFQIFPVTTLQALCVHVVCVQSW